MYPTDFVPHPHYIKTRIRTFPVIVLVVGLREEFIIQLDYINSIKLLSGQCATLLFTCYC